MTLEYQRYGRNKTTTVNKTYINSGEYRRKFDNATDNPDVNKALYDCTKKALIHRSGTELEDMYWLDAETGEILLAVTDSTDKSSIKYTDKIKAQLEKALGNGKTIISLHTHPHSMPPSIDDFNSCFTHGYFESFVACHDGKLFKYSAGECISMKLYEMYIQSFQNRGFDEFNSQLKSLEKIASNYKFSIEEVF